MLNLIEQTARYLSVELLSDIPKYLYALSNLTWTLIQVHKIKSHMIHLSHQVCFK